MLNPGYYIRELHMKPDGRIVPGGILVDKFFADSAEASHCRGELAPLYKATDMDLDIVEMKQQMPTLSIENASKRYNVCRRTLYNWMEEGRIEYVRTPTGSRRILVDSIASQRDHRKSA